jgi:nicotinic acid mononucleotide adenylyltransferase
VASRPGSDGAQVLDALGRIPMAPAPGAPHAQPEVVFLSMAPIEASSSLARERLAAGEPVSELLDPAVERYIREHGLYGAAR